MTSQEAVDLTAFLEPLLAKYRAVKTARGEDGAAITEADLALLIAELQESALNPAVEQVLAEVPGAAALPPEQLGEILSTALAEVIVKAMAGEAS
ncbi:hypothetical protein UO65_3003 [Actinokineospora spheciospongiae]|uniref:Uncharacterized protein n=1 Tax=Actinokineospora spheciospongiae TaxID=909613 RepID=W7IL76_9PSEU|nr:hypothetical protein [Actinokineospora spheciospongiae]EWC61645.1 hypothetical protein UO65_3003 [Actinokineospora spheciospongiae]PWW62299.1 hypothetical protein DFQ13_105109 [Actinokineospora spheciospongiae]